MSHRDDSMTAIKVKILFPLVVIDSCSIATGNVHIIKRKDFEWFHN